MGDAKIGNVGLGNHGFSRSTTFVSRQRVNWEDHLRRPCCLPLLKLRCFRQMFSFISVIYRVVVRQVCVPHEPGFAGETSLGTDEIAPVEFLRASLHLNAWLCGWFHSFFKYALRELRKLRLRKQEQIQVKRETAEVHAHCKYKRKKRALQADPALAVLIQVYKARLSSEISIPRGS